MCTVPGKMYRVTAFLSSPAAVHIARRGNSSGLRPQSASGTRPAVLGVAHHAPPRMVSTDAAPREKSGNKAARGGRGGAKREKKGTVSKALRAALDKYEPVIGVEVHVQLLTRTKAFCSCSTRKKRTANVNVCPVCMGHPGALPVLNARMVELAAKAGMALGCTIATNCSFDRKNYYYADTAKNYQISQADHPIAQHGSVDISGRRIRIMRLHMEEDSAKMTHVGSTGRIGDSTQSFIDFNRGGAPLVEIVSEPDLRSGGEAAAYGQELQRILRHIGVSDCNMQDGSLRCDVNVSIRAHDATVLGTRVELKNLNSFGAVQKGVDYEIERQAGELDEGRPIVQETRTWDEREGCTRIMRVKEGAADYRYFPEPDVPALRLEADVLERWRNELPELPAEMRARFVESYGLSEYDAFVVADDRATAGYLDAAVAAGADAKQAANWIMGDIMKVLKFEKISIDECKIRPDGLAELVGLITDGVISGKIAKDLMIELVTKGGSPKAMVKERYVERVRRSWYGLITNGVFGCRNLTIISNAEEIGALVSRVFEDNPKELVAYREVSFWRTHVGTFAWLCCLTNVCV